ncbi:unnamed protein product [Psylliodes chrysocephalus]|uniref:Tetraspanin n=1 Tax=Psylliodes chrysocephalus TaxID=3402493 RepID=A0A9P0D2N9_9CUCU|nr:unnamed protein product [Psylliodes chrysocephala]
MAVVSLVGSKIILAFCNFLLLICGFTLIVGGMMVLFDNERVLLSRLLSPTGPFSTFPHPLLHYICIGAAILGIILATAGIVGCWASCVHNYCILSVYFSIVLLVLVGECAIYVIAWVWPSCMGLGIDVDELIRAVQRNYGIGGQEQFTIAVDLAQTEFHCCGVESANEYDTSYWRLQALGPSLAVPLTCCKLLNINQTRSYLNPDPVSLTLCQALERNRHDGFRHVMGCRDPLERWYRDHYFAFLGVGLIVVLVEFSVLLSSIVTCTRIYHHNQDIRENARNTEHDIEISSTPTTFKRSSGSDAGAYSNETYALTGNFKQNYKLTERA